MAEPFGYMNAAGVQNPALVSHPGKQRWEAPSIKWEDVGGLESIKRSLTEAFLLPLEHPKKFAKFGARPARGILLYGPPGCGKTCLMEAMCYEASRRLVINCIELTLMSLEQSQNRIREAWDEARTAAPSVICFDKLDLLIGNQAMNVLVKELDESLKSTASKMVLFIGATDRPEVFDDVLIRPGRIDQLFYVPKPDRQARQGILEIAFRKCPVAPNVPFGFIAEKTEDFSGAELVQACAIVAGVAAREAAAADEYGKRDHAIGDSCKELGRKHFEQAFFVGARRACTYSDVAKFVEFRDKYVFKPGSSINDWPVDKGKTVGEDPNSWGCSAEIRRTLEEAIVYPSMHADTYQKFGLRAASGALFYGPVGCDHFRIADVIAKEMRHFNFVSLKGSEVSTRDRPEAYVHDLFDKAKAAAPCVLFLGELDCIAAVRGNASGDRVTNLLLAEIDRFVARDVFLIGSTNRPELLDEALLHPGRLELLIHIPLPDLAGRNLYFQAMFKNVPLASNVPISFLASITEGFAEADMECLYQRAAWAAIRDAIVAEELEDDAMLPEVGRKHFEEAFTEKMVLTKVDELSWKRFDTFKRKWEVSNINVDDLSGLKELDRCLQEIISSIRRYVTEVQFITSPWQSPKIILHGPCVYGQIKMAKTVATKCKADFLSIKGTELLAMWSGNSNVSIRDILKKARLGVPCVLFVDELDVIATAQRSDARANSVDLPMDLLMTEIDACNGMWHALDGPTSYDDGFPVYDFDSTSFGRTCFVFIGATRRPELLRPDHLKNHVHKMVYIPLPDLPTRQGILEAALVDLPLAADVLIPYLAQHTQGFSEACLAQLCQHATRAAVRGAVTAPDTATGVMLCRRHFEVAFADARRFVDSTDVAKFDRWQDHWRQEPKSAFFIETDPSISESTSTIQWPPSPQIGGNDHNDHDNDDDLYS